MRVLLAVLAMSLCGCGTSPRPLEDLPQPKPLEAMAPCEIQLCVLRPEIVNLDHPDQLAMILACKIADDEAYRRCEAKQSAFSSWIKAH